MNFGTKSRYAKADTLIVTDARGRSVAAVMPPDVPDPPVLGYHVLRQGERIEYLAARYIGDPDGFWRICFLNNAMFAEQLSEAAEVAIPGKGG
ncbi:MAG: hypothetical protein IPM16_13275 [Chloroflexi bacterium]|nr:hypothetical protein [Chloroflexota bacterium]